MNDRIVGSTFYSERLVRFGHCDPAGIVFYPQYFVMFTDLIEDWFTSGLGVNYAHHITEQRLGFPIVSLTCDFMKPSKIGETITFGLSVERIGRSSMQLNVECSHKDSVRLKVRKTLVVMDLDQGRAIPIPDQLRGPMLTFQKGELDIARH